MKQPASIATIRDESCLVEGCHPKKTFLEKKLSYTKKVSFVHKTHENKTIEGQTPPLLNSKTAASLGVKTGDAIKVKSEIGEIETTAKVTETIVPGVVAISHHLGHWEYGRYASGKNAPNAEGSDPDTEHKWWKSKGAHPNWIIPNKADPINGQQRWMDTVVKVSKV